MDEYESLKNNIALILKENIGKKTSEEICKLLFIEIHACAFSMELKKLKIIDHDN